MADEVEARMSEDEFDRIGRSMEFDGGEYLAFLAEARRARAAEERMAQFTERLLDQVEADEWASHDDCDYAYCPTCCCYQHHGSHGFDCARVALLSEGGRDDPAGVDG